MKLPTFFSYLQCFDLFKNAANLKHKTMLILVYSSGLRVSEVVNLTIDDIFRDKLRLRIRQGKGKKDRYTILSELAIKYLEKYYRAYRPKHWLFEGRKPGTNLAVRSTQHAYYKALENSKISKKCGIHTLRHSFATHSLETGMGIFQLQKFLGHKCLKTTLQYVHLQEENIIARSPFDIYVQKYKEETDNNK